MNLIAKGRTSLAWLLAIVAKFQRSIDPEMVEVALSGVARRSGLG